MFIHKQIAGRSRCSGRSSCFMLTIAGMGMFVRICGMPVGRKSTVPTVVDVFAVVLGLQALWSRDDTFKTV